MKKIVSISLFIFGVALAAILTAGLVFYQNKNNSAPGATSPVSNSATSSSGGAFAQEIILSSKEVAKHNSRNDCWMIADNKVYNITAYLPYHPGGVGAILPYCGTDGTAVFSGLPHSSFASNLLASYYVGDLNQNITVQQNIQQASSTTPPVNQPRRQREYEGYDD